ncbi:alpha/beta hydrolase family protein [Ceratobasidium sp. AG-Ba]|nr:alpha/beta hydrolase family protein [Ceratobasidium sp. AG-Ba]
MIILDTSVIRFSIFVATSLQLVAGRAVGSHAPRQNSNISWFACPDSDTTQCAFFDVPRDYSNPSDNDTVSIFMRKLPATASEGERLGTILTNPGGPGGSGNTYVLGASGKRMQAITEGRYDLIGFDPRGVNLTGPWPSCFDQEAKAVLLDLKRAFNGLPYPHSSFDVDRAVVNRVSAMQAGSNAACVQNGDRRMLESVGTAFVVQDIVRIFEALGEDGVNFWGFSYGTILGATLAAMRPDVVKRVVLDGVSDAEFYFDDVWQWGIDGMGDTNKVLLPVIEQGNAQAAYDALYGSLLDLKYEPYDQNVFNRSMQQYGFQESLRMILCSDAAPTNISVDAHTKYFRAIGQISPIGETWASIFGFCNGWSFRSSQRYTGPWTTAKGLKKTRFPILFMSLDADPVTPLSTAIKMAKGFGDESASLLVQKGFGHCTTAHPSLCTYKHVRDYFIDGKVPANGTYCTPE